MFGIQCCPLETNLNNKMKTSSFKSSALAFTALMLVAFTSHAAPGFHGNPDFPVAIKDKAQAEKIVVGTKVAMSCTSCKTLDVKTADESKGFLAWFKAESKHGCSGCGGTVTLKSDPSGKGAKISEYTHVCSKCGDNSAYTCAAHSKHAK